MDWRHSTKEAGSVFFAPRNVGQKEKVQGAKLGGMTSTASTSAVSGDDFCKAVTDKMNDAAFLEGIWNGESAIGNDGFGKICGGESHQTKKSVRPL